MTQELTDLFDRLPADFFGTVEIAFQNGRPGVVKITQTHKLTMPNPSRDNRGHRNVVCTEPHR
jgi:hypothetical protein